MLECLGVSASPASLLPGRRSTASACDVFVESYFPCPAAVCARVHRGPGDSLTDILVGQKVTWTYTVSNPAGTGRVPLTVVSLVDDQGVSPGQLKSGDTNTNGLLDVGETWTYEAEGTAVTGAYSNKATVTGSYTDSAGTAASPSDDDTSGYTAASADLEVKKYVVFGGKDYDAFTSTATAEKPAGPYLLEGASVTVKLVVSNKGGLALSGVELTDDDLARSGVSVKEGSNDVFPDGNKLTIASLAKDASVTYTATFTLSKPAWAADQQSLPMATAAASYCSAAYTRTDGASYFGANPTITISKVTVCCLLPNRAAC